MEWARQTNANFGMSAIGAGLEGGWSFARTKWAPTITYRWTTLGGDDPSTETFERWDLFYSGGDIDTWVQGQLMKNIHYNSNVRMQRVLGRLRLSPTWRFTGSFSDFRANELNNLGGVISHLADEDIGRELLFVSEHTSREPSTCASPRERCGRARACAARCPCPWPARGWSVWSA